MNRQLVWLLLLLIVALGLIMVIVTWARRIERRIGPPSSRSDNAPLRSSSDPGVEPTTLWWLPGSSPTPPGPSGS